MGQQESANTKQPNLNIHNMGFIPPIETPATSVICGFDVLILSETHLNNLEEERGKFEEKIGKEYDFWHSVEGKEKEARNGVTIAIKKSIVSGKEVKVEMEMGDSDSSRMAR